MLFQSQWLSQQRALAGLEIEAKQSFGNIATPSLLNCTFNQIFISSLSSEAFKIEMESNLDSATNYQRENSSSSWGFSLDDWL